MSKHTFKNLGKLSGPILITGHTGFKGTWLTIMLEAFGIEVLGISLEPEEKSLYRLAKSAKISKEAFLDIRNNESVNKFIKDAKPSVIIHLAAQSLVLESYRSPKTTFDTNVLGTVNVLDSAFGFDFVQAILVTTTDKVYKNFGSKIKYTEISQLEGSDPYSASKVGVEAAVSAWQKVSSIHGGPAVLAARSGNVIGGGDLANNRLIPDLIKGFIANKEVVIRNPKSTRPWQHVTDPLFGYLKYIDESLSGTYIPALNFGPTGQSISVSEVVAIARNAWGLETKILFEGNEEKLEADFLDIDSKQAQSTLNWKPQFTQEEAVTASINWWKTHIKDVGSARENCLKDIMKVINFD
jgi:CDP-glucose 4,6-dehydratase